jgi:hypothetical protein
MSDRMAVLTGLLLVVGFHPLMRTMIGGQNTPLTFLLLVGFLVAMLQQRALLAGVFLGLLSYKPQLLPLFVIWLLSQKNYRALFTAVAVTGAHYFVGALYCGPGWPLAWMRAIGQYAPIERAQNSLDHFSASQAIPHLLPGLSGMLLLILLTGAILFGLYRLAVRLGPPATVSLSFLAALLCGALLVSPHLQYYEAGLLVIPVVMLLEQLSSSGEPINLGVRWSLIGLYLGYVPLYDSANTLGWQPLFVVLLGLSIWAWRVAWRGAPPGCGEQGQVRNGTS